MHYMVKCSFCEGSGHNKKGCDIRKEAKDYVASLDAENETHNENVEEENVDGARKLTIQAPAPLHPTINIRAPPPVTPNHHPLPHFTGLVATQAIGSNLPTFVKGGKKYVTLNNVTSAVEVHSDRWEV
ncbi:hypothetical protein Salat_1108500 [Sesamum alatum]|uniref:Uncharacterized protein n=1 Tax=Sesamum alatum TaxID=300844 RepID=A0AAE1YNW0_9LAMI|nr:hypothetical protein Salat_1108500 [Sesamum alatum]